MKAFFDIGAAEDELQRIFTKIRPLINVEASSVSLRGRKPSSEKQELTPKQKLTKSLENLERLREQAIVLDNLIANINSAFRNSQDEKTQKILSDAYKLKSSVNTQLTLELENSRIRAEKNILPAIKQIANQLRNHYNKLGLQPYITYEDGIKDGNPISCAYLVLRKVIHDDSRHVIALTENNRHVFINPSLTKMTPPGHFNKGFPLRSKSEAIRYIDAQLESDKNSSNDINIPNGLKLVSRDVKTVSIKDNTISVVLRDAIKNAVQAQEAANNIYRELLKLAPIIDQQKNKLVYTLNKGKTNYIIRFKFAKENVNKSVDKVKNLLELFTPTQIVKIRKALLD